MRTRFNRVGLLATAGMMMLPLAAGSPAAAQSSDTNAAAMTGPIRPMTGYIRAFHSVDPQTGYIRAFEGALDPHTGYIRAFDGDITPYTGYIRAFAGGVDPHTGYIRAFGGDLDPYTGYIRAFWGTLTPEGGDLSPQTGYIRAFSDQFFPHSTATLQAWAGAGTSGDYAAVASLLQQMQQDAAGIWGDRVTAKTGQSFAGGFADAFWTKWGLDPADPQSLATLEPVERQLMLLDWHDNLLLFSGLDSADHWMNAVNWRPALTQVQGGGRNTTIGLVDFFAAADSDVASKVVYDGGYEDVANPHGTAVGSLMVASHDGHGVMGIAPDARIAAYNPFDHTMTASWTDVRTGVEAVVRAGASVVNLSLGVSGQVLPGEWRGVFRHSSIDSHKDKVTYVIAAGNDGVAQPTNIEMNGALDSTFLVVGSVGPGGVISPFSNTPGTACLTDGGICKNTAVWARGRGTFEKADYLKESGLLMNRFLVAPGELILVSDGHGGVTRMSGTSFAAPLVSGAIALLHDRWPWLKNAPRATAKIILESAQDLGAPGVDPVYGHGLLDIEASQAPLDFSTLKYYLVNGFQTQEVAAVTLRRNGVQASWTARDAYFTAFEKVDSAERDFLIPLTNRLFNASLAGRSFQEFVYHRMIGWIGGGASNRHIAALTDSMPGTTAPLADGWTLTMRGRQQQVPGSQGIDRLQLRTSMELTAPDSAFSVGFGHGDGALLLGGTAGLQMTGDFNPQTGGANPLLGFASGGAHVASTVRLMRGVDLQVGVTRQDRAIEQDLAGAFFDPADTVLLERMGDYRAMATQAKLTWRPAQAIALSASATRLQEDGAFLGVRSVNPGDFGRGATSTGVTLAADAALAAGFSLFASGTVANSTSGRDAALQLSNTRSTAFQLGIAKQALLGGSDRLRLSLAQPLTTEDGTFQYRQREVIDRQTGEIGLVARDARIGAPEQRRLVAEALYGAEVADGRGAASLFTSAELGAVQVDRASWTVGGNLRLGF
ncbi:S8 family serine peptidase [Croceibacterium sp. TMG7-5b_MA50]|uniref:S8 family serine peptidase n=1 Tax=Croceibacterium sp. TMG7-5b_MA50 TaxID=3121290 RepID=UPI003221D19B